MTTYFPPISRDNNTIVWAVTLSLALHIVVAVVLPRIKIESSPPEPILIVDLAPPKPALQEAVTTPAAEPESSPPPTVKPTKPLTQPETKPKLSPLPSPMAEPVPSPSPQPEAKPPVPAVITAEPKAEAKPVLTAPATTTEPAPARQEAPKPAGPSQQDLDGARNQYGSQLAREIAKYKQYPKIAQMRGWQGEVIIELHLDGSGNVLNTKIKQSSSYESLDKQALDMIRKASPFPLPPDALRGREFNVTVPIPFQLE